MKNQNPLSNDANKQHALRSQVLADLGYLLARWWLEHREKEDRGPCKRNASMRPRK